jgi:hypothetical protein
MEQRRHERVDAKPGDISHPSYQCLDISESGMKLSADNAVRKGLKFELTLLALDAPLPLKCEVMWCRKPSSIYEHGFYFGARFIDISISNQLKIRELIQQRSESNNR